MATKAKASRLKVFQAQFGFHDSIVAAPSQPAALRAWGTHQNLFTTRQASVATDPAAVEAALAHPGTPLRRPLGSNGAFEVEPTSLPVVPGPPKAAASTRPSGTPREKRPRPEPPPDRSALDAAEHALVKCREERNKEEAEFQSRKRDLETETAKAGSRHEKRRQDLEGAVAAARKAFHSAGGRG